MHTNPVAHSYIREMEELIACVLGDRSPAQIAELAGCSESKAAELAMTKDMVKLNHLLNLRREQQAAEIPSKWHTFQDVLEMDNRLVANG